MKLFESSNKFVSPKITLLTAVISVSFASIFVRLSNSSPLTISFYRMFFSTLIFLPIIPKFRSQISSLSKREWWKLISAGIFLGSHMFLWISSLEHTSVTSSVVIVTSHPLLVTLISSRILGEKADKEIYFGIIVALGGVTLMSLSDYSSNEWSLYGDLLAFLGMVMMGGYIIRGRQIRRKMHIIPYALTVYGISSLTLLSFSIFSESPVRTFAPREYLIFLALAIIPTIFGHTLYNWALKYVKARIVSISLLGEPIGASILAMIVLKEVPPLLTVLGGGITLLGIYISTKNE